MGDENDFGMDSEGEQEQVLNLEQEDDDEYEPAIQKNRPQKQQYEDEDDGLQQTEKVENQPFDEAVEINDSEDIDSEEDDEHFANQNQNRGNQSNVRPPPQPEIKAITGAYNPHDYSSLKVDKDVKELFEYISRFKPQNIELDSQFRPFIPDYIPAVGEVDAFLKMPKPNGKEEDLGITVIGEPALNQTDSTVLEMKYIQNGKSIVVQPTEISVKSIENAEKNVKEVNNWIKNVSELHKGRPPATVNYTK